MAGAGNENCPRRSAVISETVLSQQIVRLSILARPEREDHQLAIEEVKTAFRESAKNADHANRITNWLIRYNRFFPRPVDIYDTASLTLRDSDMPHPDKNCRVCDGTGWEPAWQLCTHHHGPNGSAYKSVDLIFDQAIADDLRKKIDGRTQVLYDCRRRCSCKSGAGVASSTRQESVQ